MKSIAALTLLASATFASDPCHTSHTDQVSCDADKKTGGGCTWCKCAALPSSCWTTANSKKLPASVYQCDSATRTRTALETDQDLPTSNSLDWEKTKRTAPSAAVNIIVHLTTSEAQMNTLEKTFWSVSDPESPDYGQHLTSAQVTAIVAHPEAQLQQVLQWLSSTGTPTSLTVGAHRDSIQVTLPARSVETLFHTELYQFVHRRRSGITLNRAATPYSVPDEVAASIALVSGLLQLPDLEKLGGTAVPAVTGATPAVAWPKDCGGSCTNKVTPGVLGARYSFPTPTTTDPPSTLAVSEFQGQVWDQSDLNKFQKSCSGSAGSVNFNITVNRENGTVSKGGLCKIPIIGTEACGEALLDIEYAKAIGGPSMALTDVYSSSYNLLNWATSVENIDDANLIHVHSVSYGNDEKQQTGSAFMNSCNAAFMKIGVRGVSVLFASGDQGVCGRSGCGSGKNARFHPDFPAGSPYITAVGGTDFAARNVIGDEKAWVDGGGGFSDQFAIPAYQTAAVAAYKSNAGAKLPPSSLWNNTGRGYPDVAALAGEQNPYCIGAGSLMMGIAGTSAACPVTAAIFARLNGERLKNGGKALGFLNPWIYKNAAAFNDVKQGTNTGGSSNGFTAVNGWDPATGVGTPNYAAMLKAL